MLGTKIEKADKLSRWLDWKIGIEKNNDNQTSIKEQLIHSLAKVVIEGPKVDIVEKMKKARSKNKEVVKVVKEMKKAEVKVLQEEE